ncbi:gametocyte-specific factor 1-like [Ceratina calcarata]|uniref:Gametocyte-specific factor 1-like n=1 Tax=Ceratina calcarata TaxID=156304 RepID=A0AAJ7IWU8_9HYME|nr:gametocyte-specific factor 1-like [Ceratina calcarata]
MFSNSQKLNDHVVKCPYDNHLISRSRIQKHLVKCEKRFPTNYKVMCPYDATHRIFEHELKEHVLTCLSRGALWPESFCSATGDHGSLNFDLYTDCSSMVDGNDECWDHDKCPVSSVKTAETNDEAVYLQKHASELGLEETTDDCKPLRYPRGYPEAALIEEPEGSVIEDNQSIISSMGIGRGTLLQNYKMSKRFGFGRGKSLIDE